MAMARKRKKKKKGDPLGQWKEFFQEEGKGRPEGSEPAKAEPVKADVHAEEPSETQEAPPSPEAEPPFPAPEETPVTAEPSPPENGGEEEIEGEMEEAREGEGEANGEAFVDPPPEDDPYWKEERGGAEPEKEAEVPLSQWEESLHEVTREPQDEEEPVEEEEGEEAFAWPTAEDVKNDAGGDESPEIPVSEQKSSLNEEEKVMEETNDDLPKAETGELGRIRQTIESVVQELSQLRTNRAGEVLDGLSKAGEVLEAQHRSVMDLLRNNDILAREARATNASVEKRREMVRDLEGQIAELRDANEQLRGTGERLDGDRGSLTDQKTRSTEENTRMKGESQSLREAIDRLTSERTGLDEETAELEKKRDRLEEDVRRLTKLKEEYLANLARFREDE